MDLARRMFAEALGTLFLLAAVVGSGVMGMRLAAGNDAIALLANSIATGAALYALILTFAPLSGAHFNPAVTLFELARGRISASTALGYVAAQIGGAVAGVFLAHIMFGLAIIEVSAHDRSSSGEFVGEVVATTGLLITIWSVAWSRPDAIAGAVAAYITGAYWFTSSTSFANPAVTLARSITDTFAGIAPSSVPGFLLAQAIGLVLALGVAASLNSKPA